MSSAGIVLKLFVTVIVAGFVNAQEETKCAGEAVKMTEHQKAQITECLNETGIKTVWRIPADKLSCFGVCILEKKGMVSNSKVNQCLQHPLTPGINIIAVDTRRENQS